ncbi:Peptidase C10 family protein [anaerobic digester metagenome]
MIILLAMISLSATAQQISLKKAETTANEFFSQNKLNCAIQTITPRLDSSGDTLYYIVNAAPHHYVIVSASKYVSPVIAWSSTSQFDASMPFAQILDSDIASRINSASLLTGQNKNTISNQWNQLCDGIAQSPKLQYWPDSGTTSTGGWVETHWTQSSPYNQMCPMDPVSGTRSYAGCPAIAMGQIINYLKTTQNTRFDDGDDYYHNYGSRKYYIDDDADSLGFPTFPVLNTWLDSADILYQSGLDATASTAAAIVFACGTACTQVYSSQGSGTYGVSQAYAAYQRFGFANSELLESTDSVMYAKLISNMKDGWPAHLAVVDAAWSVGHNVVVDGYRDDGYFHINFGWGGSNDGWWLVPDPSFPYSMGVLEGVVLNIIPVGTGVSVMNDNCLIGFYPNPANDVIYLNAASGANLQYLIFSSAGQLMQSGCTNGNISVSDLPAGIYFLQLKTADGMQVSKLVKE